MDGRKTYLLEDSAERDREITISLDEYRDLLDTQTRASVLRQAIVNELEGRLTEYSIGHESYNRISASRLYVNDICNIMAFNSTYKGYVEREKKEVEKYEYEKMVEREG